jgi:hypothetical protein
MFRMCSGSVYLNLITDKIPYFIGLVSLKNGYLGKTGNVTVVAYRKVMQLLATRTEARDCRYTLLKKENLSRYTSWWRLGWEEV